MADQAGRSLGAPVGTRKVTPLGRQGTASATMAGSMYHAAADTMTEGHCAAAMVAAMTGSLCRRRKVAALEQRQRRCWNHRLPASTTTVGSMHRAAAGYDDMRSPRRSHNMLMSLMLESQGAPLPQRRATKQGYSTVCSNQGLHFRLERLARL